MRYVPAASGAGLMTRRGFVRNGLILFLGAGHRPAWTAEPMPPQGGKWKAAIVGHTGQGDYGHSHDTIFNDRPAIEVVAVADPDSAGRWKAAERCKALRQYADYREMVQKEQPQLVCLASRWTNQRHDAGLAALHAGAHLYCEKPFTATLAEADDLLAAAKEQNAKIAVAHQMRLAPSTLHLKNVMASGLIGDLLEIHAWGKQDERAGGEDMMVLGSHLFDLMRMFAGDAGSCMARVVDQGRDITRKDGRHVKEQIGPVAGDEIFAQFAFPNGINGTFVSRRQLQQTIGHWGVEFVGSKTSVRLLADVDPSLYLLEGGTWETVGRTDHWQRLPTDPGIHLADGERGFVPANRRVVDDWLEAIQKNREPACSGYDAMKSLEMIMAVYHSAIAGKRINLPLTDRQHPLGA